MHTNIFIFFSGQYFNNTLSRALHILLAWFPEGLGNQATHIACLLESVHHWLNVKVTPVLFKPQMGSNPYLFKVLTNILSQYPNLDSSSYPHTGKGILLVLGVFFNYSNMKDMRYAYVDQGDVPCFNKMVISVWN